MYGKNENYEVSLMTGSAWDRTLGWIYETGRKNMNEIYVNSGAWGNYLNVSFDITKGKYSEDNGQSYIEVKETYTKEDGQSVLLTTGAVDEAELTPRNCTNNVFDLAGNVHEWTNAVHSSEYFIYRGGCYDSNSPVAVWTYCGSASAYFSFTGFRAALYIK